MIPLRILLVDVNFQQGSTGKIVSDLYTYINANGHIAAVCYGRGKLVHKKDVIKVSNNFETYLHAGLSSLTGFDGIYSISSTSRLINFIEFFKPDIVHLHDIHGFYINYFRLLTYLRNNKIRTVFTLHSEFPYTGKCGISLDCEKWQTECNKCPKLKEYPPSLYFDFTKEMFNKKKSIYQTFINLKFITPSEWLLKRAQLSILQKAKGDVIFNGIDTTNIFYPRSTGALRKKYGLNSEKIVLAIAPNLMSDFKGGRTILNIADQLLSKDVFFVLLGVNDTNVPHGNNVLLLSKTTNQNELAVFFSIANLHVICSKVETFSMTCAESICCGTPVVGFEAGGPESVFIKPFATFVPYGETQKLVQLILDNIDSKNHLKDRCVEYGRSNFAKEIMCQKYLDLYLNNDNFI